MCSQKTIAGKIGLRACICLTICMGWSGNVFASEDSHLPAPPVRPVPISKAMLEDNFQDVGTTYGTCGSIVYSNGQIGTGQVNPIYNVSANFPSIYCGDDVTLAGTARYVCDFLVRLGTVNIQQTPSFPYVFEFWDVAGETICPDNGANLLYQSTTQIATGFPASVAAIPFSTTINPPQPVPNSFWIILRTSDTSENPFVRFRTGGGNADVGSTATGFYIGYNNNSCSQDANMPHFVQYPGHITGFAYELQANDGPPGSCCNQQTGVCTDGIAQGDCNDYFESWNQAVCPAPTCAICDVTCTGSNLQENEPVCGANYIDTTNNGCSFDQGTESFITVTCGADICGTLGTYTFLNGSVTENRRDNDYYRLTLTNTRRVVWSVTAEAPANAIIFAPRLGLGAGPCDDINTIDIGGIPAGSATAGCDDGTADVCLPPGTYYLVARATTTIGIPCNIPYRATITCTPCVLPSGACCLPGGCSILPEVQCLQQGGSYRGDATTCPPTPPCPPAPTNETCLTKSTVPTIVTNTTIAFDTTFAITEDTSNIAECNNLPIFKDIWYDYRPNGLGYNPPTVTFGRIAVSTFNSCFDTRLLIYKVDAACTDPQATQCNVNNLSRLQCNDDIDTARGNLASYVEILDNGSGVLPSPGECYKIRVGGAVVDAGGAGFLRIDFVPSLPSPWTSASGRCCFTNGTCEIRTESGDPSDCTAAGGLVGYITSTTNFGEGGAAAIEFNSVGCNTLPCPAAGEACFNALNLNAILGGGFGTTTRAISNKLYYRYQIPPGTPVGSGLTISTCGSSFDTAIGVYSDFDQSTGECTGQTVARNNNCTPSETSANGANGIAPCFASNETDSCLCLSVGNIGSATGPGSVIYIEVGASNTIIGSTAASVDPVPANCGTTVDVSLTITASAACFVCNVPCPGGSIQENEPLCGQNYTDTTNAGCNANPQVFHNVTCGQVICGQSGTYTLISGTTQVNARDSDWYRLVMPSAGTISLSLNSSFQSSLSIFAAPIGGQPCTTTLMARETANAGCVQSSLSQAVCAGTFYIVVEPALLTGIDCGSPYTLTIGCGAAPAAPCCKGDMNNDGKVNGQDIQLFVRNLLSPPINLVPLDGCYNLNSCRADINGDFVLTTADIPGFVTLLLATGNCTTLPSCTDPARCHLSNQSGGSVSDIGSSTGCSQRIADDFKADVGGNIQSICWYGSYLNFLTQSTCTPQSGSSPDNFCVTIYNNNAGIPGTVLGGPFCGLAVTKVDTGVNIEYAGFGNAREYRYSAAIPSVAVVQNGCYWIEIVNSTSGNCCWMWSLSGFVNNLSASRTAGPAGTANFVAADLDSGDFAFCLNDIRINKRDCGLPLGRCCQASLTCTVTDVLNCTNLLNGSWVRGGNCVAPCQLPISDQCINAPLIPSLNSNHSGTTIGSTTDGPVMSCEASCASTCNTAPDVWYRWTAPNSNPTTLTMCPSGGGTDYDSMMVVYSGTCTSLTEVGCNDDGCAGGGPSSVQFTPTNGTTYTIRLSGWGGSAGNYVIRITQP